MLDRLESAFATQRAFVDDAGHELRTPITVIMGQLEVMGDDPQDRARTMAIVQDELARMARIVEDLLLLAKTEQPDFVRPEPVELADFTTEVLMKARTLGDRDWSLDACAEGTVALDAQRLTQALLNLARNAVEHTDAGTAVAIGSRRDPERVLFWVRDDGPGVAAADQERIFDRFTRGRNARRRSDGAGLGLAIVQAVADRARRPRRARQPTRRGGVLHHRPAGRARTPVVRRPDDPARPPPPDQPDPDDIPDPDPSRGRPHMARILIAEDEPRIADFLEKGLRASGYSTVTVDDGALAASLARDEDFDLLILDLGLPTIDGIEALGRIRKRGVAMPVIILTARAELDSTVAGLEGGADDYVTKPFRFEELLARIRVRLRNEPTEEQTVLRAGALSLDVRTRRASVGDRTVELTAREYGLLETFLRHPDQVLSREQLLSIVWGYDFDPGSNVVDVYVRYLRRKLGPESIETVREHGLPPARRRPCP